MRILFNRVVFLLCLCGLVFPAFAQNPPRTISNLITANEKSARFTLEEKASVFSIELSARGPASRSATLSARIVSPDGKSFAEGATPLQLNSFPRRFEVPLKWVPSSGLEDVSSARLIYELRLDGDSIPALSSIVSPYKLIPDVFELRFTGLDLIGLGKTYVARVRAVRPDTNDPVPGVALSGFLGDSDDADLPKQLKPTARTNAQGEAILKFRLPEIAGASDDSQLDMEIRGSRGNFKNSLTSTIQLWRRALVLLSTDKPLYQPEQTLHMRALLIDDQRRAWSKQSLRFQVRDPDDTVVFSADANSSRFGIASADWQIPASQKLGFYRVNVENSSDANGRDLEISQNVRISRYELPTFTVNVHTDQTFYLPEQNAELTVSAAYLFGQPVLRGHVRVVRESSRSWNFHDQKWDVEDALLREGDLDAKNEFHVPLDLQKDHAEFREHDWERFKDIRFAAYVTDASSGRTQERHFDLRISHEPIHLYVLNVYNALPAQLPIVLYVSSAFADGAPVSADLTVQLFENDPSDPAVVQDAKRPLVSSSARGNKFGIARVVLPALPNFGSAGEKRVFALILAKAPDGRVAKHVESYSLEKDRTFRITANKVVLNPGDPIIAKIESSAPKSRVRIDVVRMDTQAILASQEIKLFRGSTQVVFPPDDQFVGKITLVVYAPDANISDDYSSATQGVAAAAAVVFPEPSTLKLDLTPVKKSYRPGDSAAVRLQVRSTQNVGTEGAFGFLVYDQAMEELARTEASLTSGNYERVSSVLGFQNPFDQDSSLGGIYERDLLNRAAGSPVSPEMELGAEALYAGQSWIPLRLGSSASDRNFSQIFSGEISHTLNPAIAAIENSSRNAGHYPADDAAYSAILNSAGLDALRFTDPWGRPYRAQRTYNWVNEIFEFRSDGPDKTPGTADDFTAFSLRRPFFEFDQARLRSVVSAYQSRTEVFIRDEAALRLACEQEHAPLSSFIDPWGTPYRFEFGVERDNFTIIVTSAGPDRKFHQENSRSVSENDDLHVATLRSPYFSDLSNRINAALYENAKATAHFPANEQEFQEAVQRRGVDWTSLRDPWGHPYRVETSLKYDYADKITLRAYGQEVSGKSVPVTRALNAVSIFSDGPDGIPNNADDFQLATFLSPFREVAGAQGSIPSAPQKELAFYSGSTGAIRVEVKDPVGAVILNAKVTATNQATNIEYTGTSNEQGVCLVANLPAGAYRVLVQSPGFQAYVLTSVPVFSSNATSIEVTLQVGAVSQSVEVNAEAVQLQTQSSQLLALAPAGAVGLATKSGAAKGHIEIPLATPRLREYFPETLLWRPEVLTDSAGRATVKFPLADSITTWKVSVIASTLDGRIATASADLRAFQPFFAELDPPKVLTVGDEIHLPVTVRNYLEKPQSVSLDWSAEPWSQTLSPHTAQLDVPAGDYAQNTFSFRAALPQKNARQRLTAFNRSTKNESDAIERKLRVHPDGQERLAQASSIFSKTAALSLDLPANSLPGSIEAELVVYPSLVAHVSDAIEGILERPYGCAEQTISSAYPSLLWLQLQKSQKFPSSPLDARAKGYLHLAYAKLLGYRDSAGGFSYWGKGDAYIPLTAYALRFLTEASEFISVDPDVIAGTRRWLLQQASPSGTWALKNSAADPSDWATNYYTSYVVQVLSRDLLHADSIEKKDAEAERKLVALGIEFLSKAQLAGSDPYRVALLALAKLSVKQDAAAEISWLLENKHSEDQVVYWDLQRNTLFYGWGLTGRIETTALVLDAFATAQRQGNLDPAIEPVLNLGTQFLLKNKDRYHVWFSSQATVDVLQSLIRQLAPDSAIPSPANSPVVVLIDGKPGPELPASDDARQLTPRRVDLTSYLGPGPHRVEIRGDSFRRASAYLNAVYYLPWKDPAVTQSFVQSDDSESIKYAVQFDQTALAVGGQVRCTVHAERIGYRGYGMMLAEIGLPPGADVDRASLDTAVAGNWSVQNYELQPDRVVVYLWPQAGGTNFSFTLKPRFAMNAQSAESILYDYYNPLARASVPPLRFTVQ